MKANSRLREELNGTVANTLAAWSVINKLKTNPVQHKQLTDSIVDQLEAIIERKQLGAKEELKGWIERNHLGKGFDGEDRWEHCAAEIIQHLEALKEKE